MTLLQLILILPYPEKSLSIENIESLFHPFMNMLFGYTPRFHFSVPDSQLLSAHFFVNELSVRSFGMKRWTKGRYFMDVIDMKNSFHRAPDSQLLLNHVNNFCDRLLDKYLIRVISVKFFP
jgi:hypothetical protein